MKIRIFLLVSGFVIYVILTVLFSVTSLYGDIIKQL
jgi:hypothetical protein